MKNLKRAALLVVGSVFLLLLLVQVALRIPRVQEEIASRIAPVVGEGVHFSRVALAFWPDLGVSLEEVRIAGGPFGKGPDVLTAETVSLIFELVPLFAGDFDLETVSIDRALLVVERQADGSLSISEVVDRFSALEEPSEDSDEFWIPAISTSDTSLRFIDHAPDGTSREILLSDIAFALDASGPGQTASFKLDLQIASGTLKATGTLDREKGGQSMLDSGLDVQLEATGLSAESILSYLLPGTPPREISGTLDLSIGLKGSPSEKISGQGTAKMAGAGGLEWLGLRLEAPLDLEIQFDVEGSDFQVPAATLGVAKLGWEKLRGQQLAVKLSYGKDQVQITSAQLGFYRGQLKASGKFDLGSKRTFSGTLDAGAIDMPELMESAFGDLPEVNFETMHGRVEFSGVDREGESVLAQLTAKGQMRLDGGHLPASSVIGSVGGLLLKVLPKVLRPKETDSHVGQTKIEFLEQVFSFRDEVFHISKFSFITDDYKLAGNGRVGLDRKVHINTDLTFTPEGMQKLLLSVAMPIPTGGVDILPALPVDIVGSVEHPIFLPDVKGIPFMALKIVFAPIKGFSRILFEEMKGLGSSIKSW